MDSGRRPETPGSKRKDFIAQSIASSMSIILAPQVPQGGLRDKIWS